RRRIRPFLLRRLKEDVLPELPEKMEHVLLADMPAEQRRVYAAALLQLRQRVDNLLRTKGVQRGRIEVLAMITQLRQICCHPSLCMEGYAGSSGKLDALLDILPGALDSGHRVLIFSQFTSMLQILQRRLESEGIGCLYLDGKTPVQHRLTLVNRFNDGEGQVFLISLKAGGSGLNLTGADTVVHYDPWWNPAAEDQATDRAHRIGQTRAVQVIRLITRGSIEEQVAHLGERKRALFDTVVTAGEQMPTQLTEADIRALFDDATP
ncbi:MAG: DEAD/DEAH box helicase, partial [Clostridia bacterium]